MLCSKVPVEGAGSPMSVILGTNDSGLRKKLAEIIKDADASELKAQIKEMANLAITHPHGITLLEENIPGSPLFNCYQYSFGISDVRVRNPAGFLPGRGLAQFLVNNNLEEIGPECARDGDHILYSGVQIEHAGRVRTGAIESKWGSGHIWRHGVYEVPENYGDTIRFYRHFSRESALQVLRDLGYQILE